MANFVFVFVAMVIFFKILNIFVPIRVAKGPTGGRLGADPTPQGPLAP
jgi:hypothetical protein